ncbi:MAG: hypothetical protein IJJ26_08000, partial [Victivallales bacterium]|nr:hypothetical protein [Victivallales bacterium]
PLEHSENSFSRLTECFPILLQSGEWKKAEALLDKASPQTANEQCWLLSHKAHLAFLKWRDGGEKNNDLLQQHLTSIAKVWELGPEFAPKQSAMQAFCYMLRKSDSDKAIRTAVKGHFPFFRKDIRYLDEDRITRGDWPMNYGRDGFALAAMGKIMDIKGPGSKYAIRLPIRDDLPRRWLDPRYKELSQPEVLLSLQGFIETFIELDRVPSLKRGQTYAPKQKIRRASWWDDHGEMHPFDDNGPDFLLDWSSPPGDKRISLYFLDLDWRKTLHPRQHSLIVLDGEGHFQDAVWLGKINEGTYHRFLSSCNSCTFRVNKHRSACVSLPGAFCDVQNFAECPAGLPKHIEDLLKRIMKIEKKQMAHRDFDGCREAFAAISSIEEAIAFANAQNAMGIRTSRWRMLLFERVFDLLDKMEQPQLLESAWRISEELPLLIGYRPFANEIIWNYLIKRGISPENPICQNIKARCSKPRKIPIHIDVPPERMRQMFK